MARGYDISLKVLAAASLAAVLLGGPAWSAESITGPSGERLTAVKCQGDNHQCLKEARRICRGSYQVYDSGSHAGGLIADALPGPVTWYTMTFRCGRSDGYMPDFAFSGPEYRPAPVYAPRRHGHPHHRDWERRNEGRR